ncbi:MAG: N-acetylneuraminate synthase [bacterium]|nr:N-acetylneuraminate synthase [bacterium]
MSKGSISIGGKKVGEGQPVFIIAEAGVNHNGDISLAKELIDAAAKAGADAVKFQTFDPDTLVTKDAKKAEYQERNEHPTSVLPSKEVRKPESQYAMLERLALKREDHAVLKSYAEKKGLLFLSTPFSLKDAEFLKELGVPAIKVSSGDANNLPYLSRIATWGLPIILSTGMADLSEVKESVSVLRAGGCEDIVVLQCTTNYPTPFEEANLRAIETLKKELNVIVGFSDHTLGDEAALAAVALGAKVIEKHFTLDRELPGPDHKASLEPDELGAFVRRIRNVEKALGTGEKIPFESEREIAKVARKSIVTLKAVKKGELFTEENLGIKRPGAGLAPKQYGAVIGAKVTEDIPANTLITKSHYVG